MANIISNKDLFNMLRTKYPNFGSSTSKATDDFFTEKTFDVLYNSQDGKAQLNDFFSLSLRTYLQRVDYANVKDVLANAGFGEEFDSRFGGFIQRMAAELTDAVSPAWLNMVEGGTIDPFVIRKPKVTERFFEQNLQFQNVVTIPDSDLYRQIFINENGMSEFMTGIRSQLLNSFVKTTFLAKLEIINKGLNSTNYPLQDSQKFEVKMSDEPTADELTNFLLTVKNAISLLDTSPSSDAFNQLKFETSQDVKHMHLLVRTGFKNMLAVKLLSGAFNPDKLTLPVDIIEVQNFGGLQPFADAEYTKPLTPTYNEKLGYITGYTDADGKVYDKHDVNWKDPNENVLGLLADDKILFTAKQANLQTEEIRNPRGLYTNYYISMPNGTVAWDPLYNCVVFTAPTA